MRLSRGVDPSIVKGLGGMIESDVWLLFGLVQFHGMISACRDSLSLVGKCRQLLLYFARPTLCHPLRVRGMCAQRPCWVAEVAYVMPLGYLCGSLCMMDFMHRWFR